MAVRVWLMGQKRAGKDSAFGWFYRRWLQKVSKLSFFSESSWNSWLWVGCPKDFLHNICLFPRLCVSLL
jgi:hypothetical protein